MFRKKNNLTGFRQALKIKFPKSSKNFCQKEFTSSFPSLCTILITYFNNKLFLMYSGCDIIKIVGKVEGFLKSVKICKTTKNQK